MPLGNIIIVGQRLNVGHGDFGEKNKHRALNKCRAWKICQKTNGLYLPNSVLLTNFIKESCSSEKSFKDIYFL